MRFESGRPPARLSHPEVGTDVARVRRRAALATVASLALLTVGLQLPRAEAAARKPAGPSVVVTIPNQRASSPPIPKDFLGVSFEAASLVEPWLDPSASNLAALLAALGPGVLRIGGTTLDRDTFWAPTGTALPDWASIRIGPADLQRLANLSRASGWRVILGLNLRSDDPAAAAAEAGVAASILGPQLVGFEIGNEPEAYVKYGWRPSTWGLSSYLGEVIDYRDAIAATAPGVPLIGPASNSADFVSAFSAVAGGPGVPLTAHSYSLTACGGTPPTTAMLLGGGVAYTTTSHVRAVVAAGTDFGRPVRIAETNSIACGGDSITSNTHAGGVWAADDLLRVAQLGAVGVNLHGGVPGVCGDTDHNVPWYAPVCAPTADSLAAGVLAPQPEWYAMRLLRPVMGSAFAPERVATRTAVRVWSTLGPDGTRRVVVLNPEATGTQVVQVNAPGMYGIASIDQVAAPSLDAVNATGYDGQPVTGSGLPVGKSLRLIDKAGVVRFGAPAGTVTLLTLTRACTVPNLTNLPAGGARSALAANGCGVGTIATHKAPKNKKVQYVVVRQSLRPGRLVGYGTRVGFTLAPKKPPVKKPKAKPSTAGH
jgi:hypothetical protein